MSSYQLREMLVSDLPAVNHVLSKAFTSARIEEGYKNVYVPACHLSFLEMYLTNFPQGCFVLEHKHGLIGYAFSHLWGEVGWIGPVSIIPAHQGKRLGHDLMQQTISALQQARARVIGLETMPRNYRNIGFYGKLGFSPGELTLDMIRRVPPVSGEALPARYEAQFFSQAERSHVARKIDELARQVDPALSLTREIELARRFKYGDALCLSAGEDLLACAIAHTETYSAEEEPRYLKVVALLLAPGCDELLAPLISLLSTWAARQNLDTVCVRTPTRYQPAFHALLALGFRIFHAELRMTLAGHHECADPGQIYCSKWE